MCARLKLHQYPRFVVASFEMAKIDFIDDCELLKELAPVIAAPIKHHVFVCTGKSCSAVDSAEVKAAFEKELMTRGILFGKEKKGKNPRGTIVLTECASVGFCAVGAAVMVYPDGVWYAQVRATDVPEIVEEHLMNGRAVSRLTLLKIPATGDLAKAPKEDSGNWDA
jgi:(2Fe-2S) ferredoxin